MYKITYKSRFYPNETKLITQTALTEEDATAWLKWLEYKNINYKITRQ